MQHIKRIYLSLIAITFLCYCQAQDLLKQDRSSTYNMFVAGDKLTSLLIETPTFEYKKGTNQVWDMRNLQVVKKNVPCSYYHPIDSTLREYTAKLQNSTSIYYKLENNKIYRMGLDNHTTSIKYDIPEPIQYANVAFDQYLNGHILGKGIYADKDSILLFGTYHTEVAAKGIILISEENTLQNVLLQHTKKDINYSLNHNDTISLSVVEDKWFAPDYRYPIIECRTVMDAKGKCLEEKTYYTPLNNQILGSIFGNKESILTQDMSQNQEQEDHLNINDKSLQLKQNSEKIELDFYNDKEQAVTYGIYTNEGMVVFQQSIQKLKKGLVNKVIHVNLRKNNTYIFKIEQEDHHQTYKFIAK